MSVAVDLTAIFVSCEDIEDQRASAMIAALVAAEWRVEHSPRNPARGADSRWQNWYARGCADALTNVDAFVGIATDGWNGTTWMAHEAQTALDLGLHPFLWNPDGVDIPPGMRRYSDQPLEKSLGGAIQQLAAFRNAPPPLLDRHLARLFRFCERLPGCPTWSAVAIGEDLDKRNGMTALVSPNTYVDRFTDLVTSRAWVNLHAVGVLDGVLMVSVEVSPERTPRKNQASVQLSGPARSVAASAGWKLSSTKD